MQGLECEEHHFKHKIEKVASSAYNVKELISTSVHDKLKDHVLQKLQSGEQKIDLEKK